VHDHSPIYRQADDSRIEEVLRRYQSGTIGQRKGTKGINSDSSTWSKDIRIELKNRGMQCRDGVFTIP